ncbi:DUF6170 family protein [Colwelliaceae bacterium BS250]
MKFYFSSKQFKQLQDYCFADRQSIIALATDKIKPVARITLNILKLAIIIPPFMMLANLNSWLFILPLGFVLVSYFIIVRPLSLFFIAKHIDQAIEEFSADN